MLFSVPTVLPSLVIGQALATKNWQPNAKSRSAPARGFPIAPSAPRALPLHPGRGGRPCGTRAGMLPRPPRCAKPWSKRQARGSLGQKIGSCPPLFRCRVGPRASPDEARKKEEVARLRTPRCPAARRCRWYIFACARMIGRLRYVCKNVTIDLVLSSPTGVGAVWRSTRVFKDRQNVLPDPLLAFEENSKNH